MTSDGLIFLVIVIGALTLFGGVLAFASWEESRAARKQRV